MIFFHRQQLQNARQPQLQEMKSLPKHACQLSPKAPLAFLLHKAAQMLKRGNNVAAFHAAAGRGRTVIEIPSTPRGATSRPIGLVRPGFSAARQASSSSSSDARGRAADGGAGQPARGKKIACSFSARRSMADWRRRRLDAS